MTCGWSVKKKELSFISYYIIYFDHFPINHAQICLFPDYFIPNPFLPNGLLCSDHSLIDPPPNRSLACSPIKWLFPPTRYLVLLCPTCSLIAQFLPPTLFWSNLLPNCSLHSTHPVPSILMFQISLPDCSLPTIYRSQTPTQSLIFCFVPGLLISNLPLIFEKILAFALPNW